MHKLFKIQLFYISKKIQNEQEAEKPVEDELPSKSHTITTYHFRYNFIFCLFYCYQT